MIKNFADLEDRQTFCDAVCAAFEKEPREIGVIMGSDIVVDRTRVVFAHNEYLQAIKGFAIYLDSGDPDHYKRSGALLHALISSEVITSVKLEYSTEDLESGLTRVTLGDAQHYLPFIQLWQDFHNQLAAFEFAYRLCAMYEVSPRVPEMDYIYNVCRYLKCESNLSVDACFMLFKSLML